MGDSSSDNPTEMGGPNRSWPKFSLLISVFLWLLAWEAIVWFVPIQPRVVIPTSERLMGFSADGKTLVTIDERDAAHYPGVVFHVWDVWSGRSSGKFGPEDKNKLPNIVYSSERGWVDDTRWQVHKTTFPSNVWDVYALYDLVVRERKRVEGEGADENDGIIDVGFSTDGRIFAYSACKQGEGEGDLVAIDVATGQARCHVKGGQFQGIILSPDGKKLAATEIEFCGDDLEAVDVRLIVLDITTGQMRTFPDNPAERAGPIGFLPDGTKLAGGCHKYPVNDDIDSRICVWDLATGKEIGSFRSDGPPELLPDGQGLALCNHDGVRCCDLATGNEYTIPLSPNFGPEMCRGVYRALFAAPNTHQMAIRRWHPSTPGLLQQYGAWLGISWPAAKVPDDELVFADTRTGEIVASIPCSNLIEPLISPDGKSFALDAYQNHESFIEIWDIPPRKPPRWVLGLLAIPSLVSLITLWRCWSKVKGVGPNLSGPIDR